MSMIIQKKLQKKADKNLSLFHATPIESENNLYTKSNKTLSDFIQNFELAQADGKLDKFNKTCEKFYKALKSNDSLINDLSKQVETLNSTLETQSLLAKAHEVLNLLVDHLLLRENLAAALNNPNLWKSPDKIDKIANKCREITYRCMKILKLFIIFNPHFATILSFKPGFATKMLELMLQNPKMYFQQALTILEILITSNPLTISPHMYSLIFDIMCNLPKKYFARFSRVVALMVFEPLDKLVFKELPCNFTESRVPKIHNFLIDTPNFIENYVQILEHLKQVLDALLKSKSDHNSMRQTLADLMESVAFKDSGLNLNDIKSLLQQAHISESIANEIFNLNFLTKIIIKKSNITEVIFVLSNLLSGKRKIDVQKKLMDTNFFDRVLSPLFDILFHNNLKLECNDNLLGESEDAYSYNTLTTTRIQLLRMIMNMCDRDSTNLDNKDLFLSPEEIHILHELILQKALKAHHPTIHSLDNTCSIKQLNSVIKGMRLSRNEGEAEFFTEEMIVNNAFEDVKEKGLLHKIILLLGKVHSNSSFSFWLGSCVESFLRGFHTPHQIFVAHTGLLYRLIKQIISQETTKVNHVQICYDLLGEIVKFNKYNIILLENICVKFDWANQLSKHAICNIVDSNVFFRSLWLSMERFEYERENQNEKEFHEESMLCQAFRNDKEKWFILLVEAVEPNLISQDNICCINTLLILAIFAERTNMLGTYLNSLLTICPKGKTNTEVLSNYKSILSIWQKYYMLKTKDNYSLQFTSSLPFHCFKRMKEIICEFLEKHLASLENEK